MQNMRQQMHILGIQKSEFIEWWISELVINYYKILNNQQIIKTMLQKALGTGRAEASRLAPRRC